MNVKKLRYFAFALIAVAFCACQKEPSTSDPVSYTHLEPETNNDHMFYYEPSSATWSEVTVKASDPYGNVYTESIRNE